MTHDGISLMQQALTETIENVRVQHAFVMHYGWGDQPPRSLQTIATELGLSKAGVSWMMRQAIRLLTRHGMAQVADREPMGSTGRLYHFLYEIIQPDDPGAEIRLADLATTHFPPGVQQRSVPSLLAHLLLFSTRMKHVQKENSIA